MQDQPTTHVELAIALFQLTGRLANEPASVEDRALMRRAADCLATGRFPPPETHAIEYRGPSLDLQSADRPGQFKQFAGGGQMYIEHASSPSLLKSSSIRALVVDEIASGDGVRDFTKGGFTGGTGGQEAVANEWPGDGWHDMATAPRDGTMVRLLVDFTEHPTEDQDRAPTIGACHDDGHPDEPTGWQFAGWCWSHDHFTEGKGEPVGWLPLLDTQPIPTEDTRSLRELAAALELPDGYSVAEHLPGIWQYEFAGADGGRMVSGASWNHPALAACAAWGSFTASALAAHQPEPQS